MENDEEAIRKLVAEWQRATTAGDVEQVRRLMAEDALFLTPGREPFGPEVFARAAPTSDMKVEGKSDVLEIEVAGEWAWMRTRITVTMTPVSGDPRTRSGYTLTILRKRADGSWVLARDANLLPPPG